MKFLFSLIFFFLVGLGPVFAQSTSAVVNTSTCERPEYPSASKRLEEEGSVKLKFLVGIDGKVVDSQIEKSSGFRRLDEAARQGLLKCQFKPAIVGGVPQQSWASMTYTWRLETKTANSPNQCPPKLRLSAGYGCLYDYRFTSQKDIETSREVGQVAAQSPMGYVITAAKDKNCNSISIKSITSSNSGDDSIAQSLSACQKNGCECGILVNNGIVVDQNLFSKYANSTTRVTSNQPESSPINSVPLASESNLPACLGAGFGHNCWGTVTDANGTKYVGEFQNYERRGQGIQYSQSGTVLRSGTWLRNLVSAHPIETSKFPFNTSTQNQTVAVNNQSANDTSKVERDLLALEVELERRKRQELEEQLRVAQQQSAKPTASYGIERRVALVIGNATYKVNPLKNPVNDSTDMARSLRSVGFDVIEANNTTLAQMREATRRFADKLGNSDVGLVYYSGHGVEVKGKNYLIPVNADIKREYEVVDQAFDASQFLEMMDNIRGPNSKRVNILIVDACRNNELQKSWRSTNNGLARMDAPGGTFISFATAPGRVAADGVGRNSPYTKHLLQALKQPNVPIEQVFKVVRRNVMEETKGEQIPWENSSLVGDFYFTVQR